MLSTSYSEWITQKNFNCFNIYIQCTFSPIFALKICNIKFPINILCFVSAHEHKYNCHHASWIYLLLSRLNNTFKRTYTIKYILMKKIVKNIYLLTKKCIVLKNSILVLPYGMLFVLCYITLPHSSMHWYSNLLNKRHLNVVVARNIQNRFTGSSLISI